MKKYIFILLFICISGAVYAQRKVVEVETEPTSQSETARMLKRKVAIGRFSNETQYAKGLFYDKENDPMGKQALDILSTRLAASGKFILLERNDISQLLDEANSTENGFQKIGADYMIIGSITQYGRKNLGDAKVFSTTKTQIVEAAVSIRLVDVSTGLIIYSDEAKGDAELKTKTTMGIGGRADFDATLSDKAISAAISKLVENIINKCTNKPWRSYFLTYDSDAVIVSGGASQGISVGDVFAVKLKGKTVKNPQTGINIELPGKQVGKVEVLSVAGDTPETEYSIVSFKEGEIDGTQLRNYYIEEIKQ
ncbi:CsgG/HfaB family protein [Bacteroides graminisolvens]|jgi:curli biogenesis system outer membrane secretion channel CsgG|uniref:Curli production assembly/transport component CsgG n=1 Tax=Bacteroides graminisolvens DSM 19988 = JCM 15093 TaxID=1121097 RepID=A0A069D1G1_9BACE|nr:CsgG/HfaB family protein [Bacteroides graminisolvens]MBP7293388.1 penicillin-binding protein activator LpoB [Bacteroides sp.]GAK36282.1 curli production assembly/transport component CsgG [Bacteroides graminisolvens DSM 19988 = JCM 15093]